MDLDFEKNLGITERIIRAVISLLLLGLAFSKISKKWLATITKVFAIISLVEALFAYCFVHDLMGWSTRKTKYPFVLSRMYHKK
ncbi:DUF2892 domain-containing protein [Petroclostridium sp. X23]|uniref:YgaP family membrane protein n=1 Tax=Petroclostridium sp. X23 TaxID=3045146 RepID=UPI0024AE3A45|nr:DUF2892 domain-containing protein [Petroclostridium sp. X23]WHH58329.1 DUF2892 domain-containing protein [Petroclostridium sp. X23]